MKITLGKVEFDVVPVPAAIAAAVLAEPIIRQGVWRDVYRWDAAAQSGKALVPVTGNNAVALGNGVSFFIPRTTTAGTLANNEGPSKRMGEKVLAAVGARSVTDVIRALNSIVHMPQKSLPLDAFAPLNGAASYTVRMHVHFTVVQLVEKARNLSAYFLLPSQVAFHHEISAIVDQAIYDALIAENPGLSAIQPRFVVPARTKANVGIRRLALAKAMADLQTEVAAAGGPAAASDEQKMTIGRLTAEWRALTPKKA